MVYDHMLKKDGVYYQAGENVPEYRKSQPEELAEEETSLPYSDSDISFETKGNEEKKYKKADINRMSTAELQNLAASIGVEDAFDMTGGDLKKRLIYDLGL